MRLLSFTTLFFFSASLGLTSLAEQVEVDLQDPVYCDGVLTTDQGGVLNTDCLRIQAQKICYKKNKDVSQLWAEGNLLFLYKSRLFVGKKLHYDFTTNSGVIEEGRFISDPWFLKGKKIYLNRNGSFHVCNASLTTCEDDECYLNIQSPSACVKPNRYALLKDITFRFFDIPFFWIPSYKTDLSSIEGTPVRFRVSAGGYKKTRFTAKYKFLSGVNWKAFARLDFTLARGLGGGLETEHCSNREQRSFFTSSYAARDVSFDDPKKRLRYRLQGRYDERFCKESLIAHLTYDFLSDSEMASDYSYLEFELPTGRRTELDLTKKTPNWIADLSARVRINNFQPVNQELPTIKGNYHPFLIGSTGIISDNRMRAAYLNYHFADGNPYITNFQSTRLEVNPRLYRPFHYDLFTITPEIELKGLFYGNNPNGEAVGQAVGRLAVEAKTHFYRYYGNQKHILEPYLHYELISPPLTSLNNQYIFDIDDGFAKLNMVRMGINNNLYRKNACGKHCPWINVEIWANAFINTPTVGTFIPKIYGALKWRVSSFLTTEMCTAWNNTTGSPDYANMALRWTINENFAFTTEYLARGSRGWRKGDPTNFILDSFRSIQELENSPLSDRRNTFLTHFFYRIHPDFTIELQTRNGWKRQTQPSYFEYKVNVNTLVACSWWVRAGYEHRTIEDRYSLGISLGKHLPRSFN